MKYMVASDFHGSLFYVKLLMEKFDLLGCEKLIMLGDILYHGPRNPLPKEYNPKDVSELLNKYKEKIIWIRGNCDSEVDEMVIDIPCVNQGVLVVGKSNFYLSHGHIINQENNNLSKGDFLISGHTHIAICKEIDGIHYLNPGSISLPKGEDDGSFIVIDDKVIICLTFDDKVVYEVDYV